MANLSNRSVNGLKSASFLASVVVDEAYESGLFIHDGTLGASSLGSLLRQDGL